MSLHHDRIWVQTIDLSFWLPNNRCLDEWEASDSGERCRMRVLDPTDYDTPACSALGICIPWSDALMFRGCLS
jgi:hypothetical protein